MKTLFSLITVFLSFSSIADVDEYLFCQVHIDSIRKLSELPLSELTLLKKSIAVATSIEELNKATSKDASSMVVAIKNQKKITKDAAEKVTLKLLKKIEIDSISKAISLQGNTSEMIWSLQFDKCVKDSSS
ncbi:hypothetical protein NQT69_12365 [Pseudoalteromonas shioyasakiensis]|uniref:hypothetical protein n=1 Tax=Pseudoalteromonas shioyasakiensis TaxID=1190813 RepID=UPI0021193698|nr:hypothetical protein [Pseudoalteromonas shioyasakiensis]MCQ8878797.1 hypothetical protein [Pseudoalteromonas shioyasakiensis]